MVKYKIKIYNVIYNFDFNKSFDRFAPFLYINLISFLASFIFFEYKFLFIPLFELLPQDGKPLKLYHFFLYVFKLLLRALNYKLKFIY